MQKARPVFVQALCVLAFAGLFVPASAAVQLVPVVATGLSSPLFVTHGGDGSNRLFIVERGGIVRVLQPGASTPTVFLDLRSKLVSGDEQGLLGLAFHPPYASNGRLFVYYTRRRRRRARDRRISPLGEPERRRLRRKASC